jgi:hypothetical protein
MESDAILEEQKSPLDRGLNDYTRITYTPLEREQFDEHMRGF